MNPSHADAPEPRSIRAWPLWGQYAVSVGLIAVALVARWMLDPVLGERAVFITLFAVLMPMALLVRPAPFLLSAVLGLLGVWYLFLPMRESFQFNDKAEPAQLGLFACTVLGAFAAAWLASRAEARERQATQQRIEREGFITGILGSLTDAFFSVDAQWRMTFVNEEIVRRAGIPRDSLIGNKLWELFPPAVGNEAHKQLHRAMTERIGVEYEVFYQPWQRWYLEKAFPTEDGGLAVYTQDVTERKQTLETLARQTDQLRLVTDAMPALIAYVDADLRYQFNNKAYQDWFGQSPEMLRGQSIREVVGLRAFEQVQAHAAAALAGERQHFKAQIPYKGCGLRRVHSEYVPDKRPDGTVAGFYVMVNDIEEREQAQESLRETLQELARFNLSMVGRELRMLELKQEINALCEIADLPPRYPAEADPAVHQHVLA